MNLESPTVCLPPWTGSLSAVEENEIKTENSHVENEGLWVKMGENGINIKDSGSSLLLPINMNQ